MELEGLIQAYHLIPPHISPIHAVDNETAIDIHDTLAATGLPQQRSLVKLPYHSTVTRLYNAMQKRTTFLTVTHTLSHLEHLSSPDHDLNHRRKALAQADTLADEGHSSNSPIQDPSGTENYGLRIRGVLVEKASKSPFAHIQMLARKDTLYARRLEGAVHKTSPNPGWSTGGRKWPTFLRSFRHKLITQRLPTAHNRAYRGDSEEGTQVNPWCPRCMETGSFVQETHLHLLTCPCTSRQRLKLEKAINNECKQYYHPQSLNPTLDHLTEEEIISEMGSSWDITDAWKNVSIDKHGRSTTIATSYIMGPQHPSPLSAKYSVPTPTDIFHKHPTNGIHRPTSPPRDCSLNTCIRHSRQHSAQPIYSNAYSISLGEPGGTTASSIQWSRK